MLSEHAADYVRLGLPRLFSLPCQQLKRSSGSGAVLSPMNSNSLVGLMEPALLLALDLAPLPKKEVTQSALHGVLGPAHQQTTSDTLLLQVSSLQRFAGCLQRFMLNMSCKLLSRLYAVGNAGRFNPMHSVMVQSKWLCHRHRCSC